jgi:hypothetical protein
MWQTFTYSYRSRYRGSFAPLFSSSLETPDDLGLLRVNVALSFLSFVMLVFRVVNSYTDSYIAFEATIG